ncbi:hypothetical protein [Xenorhabdus griffiniae]|uniref:Phage tail protein C-terminal domain-containing protein n=1 Tax=Xenorhabdus griffiniae TaxID=351672 RepID=A0ABY9XE81_9GAMM|nr:hypothetical protein [Xenorhabdus griffiniae]MBD1228401.1 hypothetical protein [Xenorhabdus griffiniae]MBE8587946.1 hypothetical protein [Xenorhabdus griffiniae]WNH00893.1 hypothetical protein QL112_013620 [Xenorhabdus griffiniae]
MLDFNAFSSQSPVFDVRIGLLRISLNLGLSDAVRTSRKINNKPLTGDVTLNAGDVGALAQGDYGVGAAAGRNFTDANALNESGWYAGAGEFGKNFWNAYAPIMVMTRGGGDDSTGMIAQIQVDHTGLACRYRVKKKWGNWRKLVSSDEYVSGFDQIRTTGFFYCNNGAPISWSNNHTQVAAALYGDDDHVIIIGGELGGIPLYYRRKRWGKWDDKIEFITTKNITVVDGYLKSASPIIKITDTGAFETNDESEGAIVERLSEGVYLIKNVLGFNADAAWGGVDGGVEIPLCKNKLPLIWVNYTVLPDGSIKIMTYHREHSDAPVFARNVREGYADGDPIDIPVGRYISVRVQMPENSIWNQQQRKLAESK